MPKTLNFFQFGEVSTNLVTLGHSQVSKVFIKSVWKSNQTTTKKPELVQQKGLFGFKLKQRDNNNKTLDWNQIKSYRKLRVRKKRIFLFLLLRLNLWNFLDEKKMLLLLSFPTERETEIGANVSSKYRLGSFWKKFSR